MEIKVRDKNIEKALKMLKRKLGNEGLFKELKNKRYYEKPSVKAKRKRADARKKRSKSLRSKRLG